MKTMLAYIIEAAAFLFTVSLFTNISAKLGYDIDYRNIVIAFLIIWVAGKMVLRRYLVKLGEKAKKHN